MRSDSILKFLSGGDLRSIAGADQAAALVLGKPALFKSLLLEMWNADPRVSARAADAVEKVTREKPSLLSAYKAQLLGLAGETPQKEVQWHLAQMLPRLQLNPHERKRAIEQMRQYLSSPSAIVRTSALQALFDLSHGNASLRAEVEALMEKTSRSGSPAEKAGARKLLSSMKIS